MRVSPNLIHTGGACGGREEVGKVLEGLDM